MRKGIGIVVLVLVVFVGVAYGASALPTGVNINTSFLPQALLRNIKSLSLGAQLQFNRYLLRFMKENAADIVKITQDRLHLMLLMWSKKPDYDEVIRVFDDMMKVQMRLSTKFIRYYVEWLKRLRLRDRVKLMFRPASIERLKAPTSSKVKNPHQKKTEKVKSKKED